MMSSNQNDYERRDPFRWRFGHDTLPCFRPIGVPIRMPRQNCVRNPCAWGAWDCCLSESRFPESSIIDSSGGGWEIRGVKLPPC